MYKPCFFNGYEMNTNAGLQYDFCFEQAQLWYLWREVCLGYISSGFQNLGGKFVLYGS